MGIIKSVKSLFFNVKSPIYKEDLMLSRYYDIYIYHNKRTFKEYLEEITLIEVNLTIRSIFPYRISKEIKKKIIDCVVIFLKFFSVNYDYFSMYNFKLEYNKIIVKNLEKIYNN